MSKYNVHGRGKLGKKPIKEFSFMKVIICKYIFFYFLSLGRHEVEGLLPLPSRAQAQDQAQALLSVRFKFVEKLY